jgi:DNA-binding transcriptional LysR family regulator
MLMPDLNMARLQLRDLHVLEVVIAECSLTRAAEVLDTTQPAISKAVARLRLQFRDPLLVRDGPTMKPTSKASDMLISLRALLRAADDIARSPTAFDPRSSSRVFKLLVSDVGQIRFLPSLTSRLAAAGPNLKLEAVPLDSRRFDTKLANGEADLALGVYARAPRDLRRQPLYTDGYLSVVRRDHPDRRRLGRLAGFRSARHIIVTASETGHTAHQVAQETIEAVVAHDRVLLRLPSFTAAALLAGETDGVATVPAKFAMTVKNRFGLVTFRPPVAMPPIHVAQYWHERCQRDSGHRWLRETCFDLFARAAAR